MVELKTCGRWQWKWKEENKEEQCPGGSMTRTQGFIAYRNKAEKIFKSNA